MSRHVQSCRHGILSSLKDIRALFDKLNDLGLIIMIIIIIITIININLVIVIILLLHYVIALILMLFIIEEKSKSAQHFFSPFNDCPKYIKKEIFMHDFFLTFWKSE